MELHTGMSGLDLGGEIQFQPGPCTVAEIRYISGRYGGYTKRIMQPEDVEDWVEERGKFADGSGCDRKVKWIFPCAVPPNGEGSYSSSSEMLELAISQESFTRLTQRYQFSPEILDAWRYRSSSGCGARKIHYDDTGKLRSVTFTTSIRLSGDFASVIAINHHFATSCTVVLALRVSDYDQNLLQQGLERHQNLIGHPLLVPTVLVEVCLETNMWFMQKIRQELSVVEKATGQHAWLQIPAADAPAHDSELSRLGHAAKLHISISARRLDTIKCHLELIKQSLKDLESREAFAPPCQRDEYEQWISNLELLVKFREIDLTYNERRADNQITAIYGLLTQRDNMVGVAVAIESKKISEASKRDGSALKSLTVLTGVFFPATYLASLFALPTFSKTPLWVYWLVVVPLTLIIFGSWTCWTFYRQRQIARETIRRDIEQDIELDPERALPAALPGPASSSFLATLRQIRSHTKQIGSRSPPNDVVQAVHGHGFLKKDR